jgi:hypothetical protein
MEPINVRMFSTDLDGIEPSYTQYGGSHEQEDVNTELLEAIQEMKTEIFDFKKLLFKTIVSNDTAHSASDMKALMSFHAIWLQSIAYWIGILDNKPVPMPEFTIQDEQIKASIYSLFTSITEAIESLSNDESDGITLVWNLLTTISTQNYPFDLGEPVENNTP